MNKYNASRGAGGSFDVSRGSYRGALRQNYGSRLSTDMGGTCGCERESERNMRARDNSRGYGGRIAVPNNLGCECERARGGTCGCADKATISTGNGCGCGTAIESRYGLTDRPLGSVYSPLQDFDLLYDHERALARGTLFSTLDLPLEVYPKGGRCRG